jgi:hypothetical protein
MSWSIRIERSWDMYVLLVYWIEIAEMRPTVDFISKFIFQTCFSNDLSQSYII